MTEIGTLSAKEIEYRSGIDPTWLINKPTTFGNWLIWPETLLNNMDIASCKDTIDGICRTGKTLHECIGECHGDCAAGLYFKFTDGDSICVPIRTAMHPTFNPIYRLRRQDYYNLKDVKVSTFVNTDFFPNPPRLGNAVLYYDIINMENPITKDTISTVNSVDSSEAPGAPNSTITKFIYLDSKNISNNIQLIPAVLTAGTIQDDFPIAYGDKFIMNIPGTNLVATKFDNTLEWSAVPYNVSKPDNIYFSFRPIGDAKKIGDIVSNQEELLLYYSDSTMVYMDPNNKNLMLKLRSGTSNPLWDIAPFVVKSKMVGNYCDKVTCMQVPLEKITPTSANTTEGKYKDSSGNWTVIYRHRGCWNICANTNAAKTQAKTQAKTPAIVKFGIVFSIVILAILSLKLLRRR